MAGWDVAATQHLHWASSCLSYATELEKGFGGINGVGREQIFN